MPQSPSHRLKLLVVPSSKSEGRSHGKEAASKKGAVCFSHGKAAEKILSTNQKTFFVGKRMRRENFFGHSNIFAGSPSPAEARRSFTWRRESHGKGAASKKGAVCFSHGKAAAKILSTNPKTFFVGKLQRRENFLKHSGTFAKSFSPASSFAKATADKESLALLYLALRPISYHRCSAGASTACIYFPFFTNSGKFSREIWASGATSRSNLSTARATSFSSSLAETRCLSPFTVTVPANFFKRRCQ